MSRPDQTRVGYLKQITNNHKRAVPFCPSSWLFPALYQCHIACYMQHVAFTKTPLAPVGALSSPMLMYQSPKHNHRQLTLTALDPHSPFLLIRLTRASGPRALIAILCYVHWANQTSAFAHPSPSSSSVAVKTLPFLIPSQDPISSKHQTDSASRPVPSSTPPSSACFPCS